MENLDKTDRPQNFENNLYKKPEAIFDKINLLEDSIKKIQLGESNQKNVLSNLNLLKTNFFESKNNLIGYLELNLLSLYHYTENTNLISVHLLPKFVTESDSIESHIRFQIKLNEKEPFIILSDFLGDRKFIDLGLGSFLLKYITNIAQNLNLNIKVHSNTEAIDFYKKNNFVDSKGEKWYLKNHPSDLIFYCCNNSKKESELRLNTLNAISKIRKFLNK